MIAMGEQTALGRDRSSSTWAPDCKGLHRSKHIQPLEVQEHGAHLKEQGLHRSDPFPTNGAFVGYSMTEPRRTMQS